MPTVRVALLAVGTLLCLALISVIESHRLAVLDGYLTDWQGLPVAAIAPRYPWELDIAILAVGLIAVWIGASEVFQLAGYDRVAGFVAIAIAALAFLIIAAVNFQPKGSPSRRWFVIDAISDGYTVTLAFGALALASFAALHTWRGMRRAHAEPRRGEDDAT